MSRLYQTDLGTSIGTASAGPIVDGVRQLRFTWHVNPLDFYKISQSKPPMTDDEGVSFTPFDHFIEMVSKRQIQEIDIDER